MLDEKIREIIDEILKDPELTNEIISGYEGKYPDITEKEIIARLSKALASEYSEVADDEARLLQRKASLNVATSKALRYLPDSGEMGTTKIRIKEAAKVSTNSSSTGLDTGVVADLLNKCGDDFTLEITKKRTNVTEIDEELDG